MLRFFAVVWLACAAIVCIVSGAMMAWLEPNKLDGAYLGAIGAVALAGAMLLISRWRLI